MCSPQTLLGVMASQNAYAILKRLLSGPASSSQLMEAARIGGTRLSVLRVGLTRACVVSVTRAAPRKPAVWTLVDPRVPAVIDALESSAGIKIA